MQARAWHQLLCFLKAAGVCAAHIYIYIHRCVYILYMYTLCIHGPLPVSQASVEWFCCAYESILGYSKLSSWVVDVSAEDFVVWLLLELCSVSMPRPP